MGSRDGWGCQIPHGLADFRSGRSIGRRLGRGRKSPHGPGGPSVLSAPLVAVRVLRGCAASRTQGHLKDDCVSVHSSFCRRVTFLLVSGHFLCSEADFISYEYSHACFKKKIVGSACLFPILTSGLQAHPA